MKKIIIILISLIVIFLLIIFVIKDKVIIIKILQNIENNTGINIELKDNQKWSYYPKITYQNNLSLDNKNDDFFIQNSNITITRNYELKSPFIFKYQSPSIIYKGVNFRDSKIDSEYKNKIIKLNKFSANLIDGSIDIKGYLSVSKRKKINLNGSYKNISINRILKQLKITNWERAEIKLSSSNFSLQSVNGTKEEIIKNLDGEMIINGSIFFVSKEEERFGAALLTLLSDKFTNIKSLSQSLNYLLNKFADLPSNISGKININKGILTTEKLLIENKKGKAMLTASLDLISNDIDGKINLYKNNIIFLTAKLKGNIENPEILIGGEIFTKEKNNHPQNLKKIFEEGIQSLIDNILQIND